MYIVFFVHTATSQMFTGGCLREGEVKAELILCLPFPRCGEYSVSPQSPTYTVNHFRELTKSSRAVFEALAKAQYLMTHGRFPSGGSPASWSRMVHRDIKTNNFFLSEPLEDRWPGLPSGVYIHALSLIPDVLMLVLKRSANCSTRVNSETCRFRTRWPLR